MHVSSKNRLLGAGYEYGRARKEVAEVLLDEAREKAQHAESGSFWPRAEEALERFRQGELHLGPLGSRGKFPVGAGVPVVRTVLDRWAESLVIHGRRLDDQLDVLLSETTALEFTWRSPKRPLVEKMDAILLRREDLRAYEREVEDFIEGVTTNTQRDLDVLPVTQLLNQIQRTYDRTYDLCTFKLTTITSTRATYASILVAVVAAVIAVLSFLSSR